MLSLGRIPYFRFSFRVKGLFSPKMNLYLFNECKKTRIVIQVIFYLKVDFSSYLQKTTFNSEINSQMEEENATCDWPAILQDLWARADNISVAHLLYDK